MSCIIHNWNGYVCETCGITRRDWEMEKGKLIFGGSPPKFDLRGIPLPIVYKGDPKFSFTGNKTEEHVATDRQLTEKAEEEIMGRETIQQHEGAKYLRLIQPASKKLDPVQTSIHVDVYCVLVAFNVTDQMVGHAIKKLLCAGERGKGDRLADLKGAMAALNRAIDFEEGSQKKESGIVFGNSGGNYNYFGDLSFFIGPGMQPLPKPEQLQFVTGESAVKGEWEVIKEEDGKGARVRWSIPDNLGRYLWVRHYLTDNSPGSPTKQWCENAAERDAKRFNDDARRPEEYTQIQ